MALAAVLGVIAIAAGLPLPRPSSAPNRSWTFALNLDMTRPEHPAARMTIGRAILHELGALP